MLFTGFILTADGPRVLEYNVRFGDPETQALMLLLDEETDLAEVMMVSLWAHLRFRVQLTAQACVEGRLDSVRLGYREGFAVSVVCASDGYPGKYAKGVPMQIDPTLPPGESRHCHSSLISGAHVFHAGTTIKDSTGVTDGGRVLAVAAHAKTLREAVDAAYRGVDKVDFEGKTYRRDIAYRALSAHPSSDTNAIAGPSSAGLTYAAAGVSVDAGNDLVTAIKPIVKATRRPGADSDIGGFGGAFDMRAAGYVDPILVSGTDGCGTKLRVALEYGKHSTVGIDLVAMCVNDLIVQGAEPLYFLDYYACSKLDVEVAADVITGIAEGCIQAGCALIGGETAEMPGMYHGDDYDLAGFAVGAVERSQLLPTPDIQAGDVLIAVPSSGPHSNGFSLIRKVVSLSRSSYHDPAPWSPNTTIGEELLIPTKIYIKSLLPGARRGLFKGMSHITGGGFTENIPRIFGSGLGVKMDLTTWDLPPIWHWIMKEGNIEAKEMARTFNCGVGMVIVVAKNNVEQALDSIRSHGEQAWVCGEIMQKEGVEYVGMERWSI